MAGLTTFHGKRGSTSPPNRKAKSPAKARHAFVIQKHDGDASALRPPSRARRRHEKLGGDVAPFDPREKRLAVQVETIRSNTTSSKAPSRGPIMAAP